MEIRISMGGKSYVFTDTLNNAFNISKGNKNGKLYKHSGLKNTVRTCNHSRPVLRRRQSSDKKSLLEKIKTTLGYTVEGNQIDRYSRFLFPFSYSLFLAIYFMTFIFGGQSQTEDFPEGEFN